MDEFQARSLWEQAEHCGITRRRFLALLAIGGAGAVLAACGAKVGLPPPSEPGSASSVPPPSTTSATPTLSTPTETTLPPSANPTSSSDISAAPSVPLASGLPRDLADANPAVVDNSQLPITPVDDIGVIGSSHEVDIDTYTLAVDGLVNNPLTLSYRELLFRPTVTETVLLVCPGFLAANPEWTVVPVSSLLAEAGVQPVATHITFYAVDGDRQSFSLADLSWDGLFLAHTVDGQTLPKEHGYPIRLIQKGHYGSSWLKWLNRISIT